MEPKKIKLTKLYTRTDAEFPQKEKYPDNTIIEGLMWSEFSKPKVGQVFRVLKSKLYASFQTSIVTEIVEETEDKIIFKTLNSVYELQTIKDIKDEIQNQ